jgi:hypothetical protein
MLETAPGEGVSPEAGVTVGVGVGALPGVWSAGPVL